MAKAFTIMIGVVYSEEAGGMSETKATTIERIKAEAERLAREGIPDGMQCSLITAHAEEYVQ